MWESTGKYGECPIVYIRGTYIQKLPVIVYYLFSFNTVVSYCTSRFECFPQVWFTCFTFFTIITNCIIMAVIPVSSISLKDGLEVLWTSA